MLLVGSVAFNGYWPLEFESHLSQKLTALAAAAARRGDAVPETPLVTLLVPPRREYSAGGMPREHFKWEREALRRATHVVFWFARDVLAPVALFDLGAQSAGPRVLGRDLFVGWDSSYIRAPDLAMQLRHAKPGVTALMVHSLAQSLAIALLAPPHLAPPLLPPNSSPPPVPVVEEEEQEQMEEGCSPATAALLGLSMTLRKRGKLC